MHARRQCRVRVRITPQMWRLAVPRYVMGVPVTNPYGNGLGALDPTDATNQVFPTSSIKGSAGQNQAVWNSILASAQQEQMLDAGGAPAYQQGTADCAGAKTVAPALMSVAGGIGLKFAPAVLAAGGPIAAAALVTVAVASEIFGAIFGKHAAAISREQSVLCAAVPAANQALALIDQGVQSGQITPQQALAAVQALPGQFQSQVASIMKGTSPTASQCNAACVMLSELKAICLVKASAYQDMIAAAPAAAVGSGSGVASAVSSVASSTGLPSWLFWLGGAYLLWEFL